MLIVTVISSSAGFRGRAAVARRSTIHSMSRHTCTIIGGRLTAICGVSSGRFARELVGRRRFRLNVRAHTRRPATALWFFIAFHTGPEVIGCGNRTCGFSVFVRGSRNSRGGASSAPCGSCRRASTARGITGSFGIGTTGRHGLNLTGPEKGSAATSSPALQGPLRVSTNSARSGQRHESEFSTELATRCIATSKGKTRARMMCRVIPQSISDGDSVDGKCPPTAALIDPCLRDRPPRPVGRAAVHASHVTICTGPQPTVLNQRVRLVQNSRAENGPSKARTHRVATNSPDLPVRIREPGRCPQSGTFSRKAQSANGSLSGRATERSHHTLRPRRKLTIPATASIFLNLNYRERQFTSGPKAT